MSLVLSRSGAMRIVRGPQPLRAARARTRVPTARRGEAGERVVRAALAAALDDHYVLVHDLYLPGGEGDVERRGFHGGSYTATAGSTSTRCGWSRYAVKP